MLYYKSYMPRLSKDDVLKLARLARLKLNDQEIEAFQSEIGSILEYITQLEDVDLDDFQPTSQVTGLKNVMRPDTVKDYGASAEALLKNAPAIHDDGHIKVRRVL